MNTKMLKTLVDLSDGEVDVIDTNEFFSRYPRCTSTENDLNVLQNYGFVSLSIGDNHITEIGVNQKAIDYFN